MSEKQHNSLQSPFIIPKGQEFIRVVSAKGHYNCLDPTQERINTYIGICTEDEHTITTRLSCNITTEEIIETKDVDTLIEEINRFLRSICYCSREEEIKKVRTYLTEHKQQLQYGNALKHRAALIERRNRIDKEITHTEADLEYLLEDTSRFVNGAWVSSITNPQTEGL